MGSLDPQAEQGRTVPQVCRFLKIDPPFTGPSMRDQVNTILDQGWTFVEIDQINTNYFAVFTRTKRQQ